MKNQKLIYDEKTSNLYAPDGTFVKRLYCPKAKQWNQLVIEPGETRWRGCEQCKEKVYDLDSMTVDAALNLLRNQYSKACVHVSEKSEAVIFLKDGSAVRPLKNVAGSPINIQTVYGKADIARGYAMGYWPDVRIIRPDPKMNSKISVGQNPITGEVDYSHDYRGSFRNVGDPEYSRNDGFEELHPFVSYYPYHKPVPLAAYLVPKGLPNGTCVIVDDPIENILGTTWNQGGGWKPDNVPGYVENNKIVLELDKVKVSHAMG
ncbi:MAG: hypothetical protein ACKOWD_08995 [Rhodoferax sp.]